MGRGESVRVWRQEAGEGASSGLVVVLAPSGRGSAKYSAATTLKRSMAGSIDGTTSVFRASSDLRQ